MKKLLLILLVILFSGCAITYEPAHKCELMQRGEPCLIDHRCCNPPQTYHYQSYPNWHWWYWNKPTYTNYVIVKPNNKPNNKPNSRPSFNNNNSNNNGSTRPNQTNTTRKPKR